MSWLDTNNAIATTPASVEKVDVVEYLAHLCQRGVSGVSRARKLTAIREFFRFLVELGILIRSPTAGLQTPEKERNGRTFLHPVEYNHLLSLAGSHPRDFAILQVFLQTGVRVSEFSDFRLEEVDLAGNTLRVRARKRMVARAKGVSPFHLQQWLGHADLNTTQICVHLGRQNAKRIRCSGVCSPAINAKSGRAERD